MKVLVIEDSAAVAAVLRERLETLGHRVQRAVNGAHGLQCFMADTPDLVLMDLAMPVMDGLEATRRIRLLESHQRWAWTPILFLTASGSDDNLLRSIEAGADDFLPKSASIEVLAAKMHAMQRIANLRHALQEANRQLEQLANCDGLTGLANRRSLDEQIDRTWDHAVRCGQPYGLLMADLDHFKNFNDRHGHLAGDDCLRSVARVLAAACWRSDGQGWSSGAFAARYGGEEFCLVFPGITAEQLQQVANDLLQEVRQRAIAHPGNPGVGVLTVSLGLGHTACAEGRVLALFRNADRCLYEAKRAGRNTLASDPVERLEPLASAALG